MEENCQGGFCNSAVVSLLPVAPSRRAAAARRRAGGPPSSASPLQDEEHHEAHLPHSLPAILPRFPLSLPSVPTSSPP